MICKPLKIKVPLPLNLLLSSDNTMLMRRMARETL